MNSHSHTKAGRLIKPAEDIWMREQYAPNEYHFLVSLTVGGIVQCYQLYLNLHWEDFNRYGVEGFHVNQAAFHAYKQQCVISVQTRTVSCWGWDSVSVVGQWFSNAYVRRNRDPAPPPLHHPSCFKCVYFSWFKSRSWQNDVFIQSNVRFVCASLHSYCSWHLAYYFKCLSVFLPARHLVWRHRLGDRFGNKCS